jgi:hypothetical protein
LPDWKCSLLALGQCREQQQKYKLRVRSRLQSADRMCALPGTNFNPQTHPRVYRTFYWRDNGILIPLQENALRLTVDTLVGRVRLTKRDDMNCS